MHTTDRPYARWLEFAAYVLSQPAAAVPHDLVAAEIRATIDCDGVAFNATNGSGMPSVRIWTDRSPTMAEQITPATLKLNPLRNYYGSTGYQGVMSLTEVPSEFASPRALAAWREFSEPWDAYHQLALPVFLQGQAHRVYSVARPSGAFTRQELELVRTLQPLLVTMDRQAAVLGRLPAHRLAGEPLLTGREMAVLALLADGLTAAAIGRRLGVTPRTVTKHLEHVYAKLQVTNRVTAVIVAQRSGILSCPAPRCRSRAGASVRTSCEGGPPRAAG